MSEYLDIGSVLGNKASVAVLKYLYASGAEQTGRAIASGVGLSPQTTLNTLNSIEGLGLVSARKVGMAKLYLLNGMHWLVSDILVPAWTKIDGWIFDLGGFYAEQLKPRPVSIILYGSFAKGVAKKESDIDLLLIFPNTKDVSAQKDMVLSLGSEVIKYYGVHPSPTVISAEEAAKLAKEKKGFLRNVLLSGRSIYGLSPSEVLNYDSSKNKNSRR